MPIASRFQRLVLPVSISAFAVGMGTWGCQAVLGIGADAKLAADSGVSTTDSGTEGGTALLNNASFGHRRFGAPRVSPEQMMEWVAAWLLRGGPTLGKPTHFEVRDGKY